MAHLNAELSREIRETVGQLPLYAGDPKGVAIDYTHSQVAYAVNVTLLVGHFRRHPSGVQLPTRETRAMLVRRASGDGKVGSWSGVSGYVDTLSDPERLLTNDAFDPVAYTARAELHEECGIAWEVVHAIDMYVGAILRDGINLALGRRFEEARFAQHGVVNVLPLLGVCHEEPAVELDPRELSESKWVSLGEIAQTPDLSPGYVQSTLPRALGALGLRDSAIADLLQVEPSA